MQTPEMIVDYLTKHPMRGAKRIAADLGLDRADADAQIEALLEAGTIRRHGQGFSLPDAEDAGDVPVVQHEPDVDDDLDPEEEVGGDEGPEEVPDDGGEAEESDAPESDSDRADADAQIEGETEDAPAPSSWKTARLESEREAAALYNVHVRWLRNSCGRVTRHTGTARGRDLRRRGYRIDHMIRRGWISPVATTEETRGEE